MTGRPEARAARPRPPVAADGAGPEPGTPRRTNLTGRAAVLALVVCLLAISLAYPLREYLSQRAEIGSLETEVGQQERRVVELERAQERWQDPAFVKAQARERLHFVMPGETSYVVLEPDEAPAPQPTGGRAARPEPKRPWFGDLWRSVEAAGKG